MIAEHDAAMLALLAKHELSAESWVYGSYCRRLSGTWFRVKDAETTVIQVENRTPQQPYSYVVTPGRMDRDDVNGNELDLVSRPARPVKG